MQVSVPKSAAAPASANTAAHKPAAAVSHPQAPPASSSSTGEASAVVTRAEFEVYKAQVAAQLAAQQEQINTLWRLLTEKGAK